MCSLHLCLCSFDNCSLGNCSQNCTDTRVLTDQIDASAIYLVDTLFYPITPEKGLFWHENGIFCLFEWNSQGCQNAYTFLHSQPDQLIKKATESDEIQNGNKMYHDICLITACSANSSSDWKKKKSEREIYEQIKRLRQKVGYKTFFCKFDYFHLQTGLLHQDAHTHLKIVSKVAICLEKCMTWPLQLWPEELSSYHSFHSYFMSKILGVEKKDTFFLKSRSLLNS